MIYRNIGKVIFFCLFISIYGCKTSGLSLKQVFGNEKEFDVNVEGVNFHQMDLKGLKPGMKKKEVEDYIALNLSSGYKISTRELEYGTRIAFFKDGGYHSEAIIFSMTGLEEHDTVYAITVAKTYMPDSRPTTENFFRTIDKKFGPWTFRYINKRMDIGTVDTPLHTRFIEAFWQFNEEGAPSNPKCNFDNKCINRIVLNSEIIRPPHANTEAIFEGFDIVRCKDNCNYQLALEYTIRFTEGAINGYTIVKYNISIADLTILKPVVDKVDAENNAKKAIELQQQLDNSNNQNIDL